MKEVYIKDIVNFLNDEGCEYLYLGNDGGCINGFSPLSDYIENTITWIKNPQKVLDCDIINKKLSLVVLNEDTKEHVIYEAAIVSDNPKYIFSLIVEHFYGKIRQYGQRGQYNVIAETAKINETVNIGNHCTIGNNVIVGAHTQIYDNVIIRPNTIIGEDCIIKSGAVIGEEGYGYSKVGEENYRVPHYGGVIIGNKVEIGANTCIDRGTMANTVIGDGVKIDNLCHIAHNVIIGKNACVVAGSILCGSSKLGECVYIAPGAIVKNQIEIKSNTLIGLGSVVVNDIEKNKVIVGIPGRILREKKNEEL